MQTEGELSPSHFINGFTAQFPNIDIEPNDTMTIFLHEEFDSFYQDIIPNIEAIILFFIESSSLGQLFIITKDPITTISAINIYFGIS